jgi:hypothetical protein
MGTRLRRLVPFALVAGALVFGTSAAAEVINGVIDGTEPTRANVPFDNDVASACPASKPYPGNLAQPGTHYDAYPRPSSPGGQCLTVSLQLAAPGATDCALNPAAKCGFAEIYTALNPADAGSGYLGDIGSPVAPGQTRSFSVVVPAGSPYTAVVDEYNPGAGTTNYTLTITGSPTAVRLQSLSARRARGGVLVRWRVASATGTLGFDVFRLTGSSRARLNASAIPVRAGQLQGSYAFLDRRAPRAARLRYEIDAIGLDGTRMLLGVATAAPARR